jgi:FixJ family two-component response regulator
LRFFNTLRRMNQLRDVPLIAIVDDEESVREGTLRLVRSLGFSANAFPSARAFLNSEKLKETSCLLSDIHMPEMSGTELQDALRAGGHNIPIVFITAYPDAKIRSQVLAQGAICFLEKPVEVERLSRCIDEALRKSAGKNG